MEIINDSIDAVLDNITDARQSLDEKSLKEFEDVILKANNIFVAGIGRSGLVAKAFAMRLMHVGFSTYVVGETISPSIFENDCLIVISGSGETNTVVSATNIAKDRGSKVLVVTSFPDSTLGQLADSCLYVKGRINQERDDENYLKRQIHGNYTSLTPLGTAFELTALVFLDAVVFDLMEKKK